ncbi:MAG: chromosome segregation protein SMC [Clostridiales bacterium]|nr:chromosome segregation protein SMC [Clostridiales bacterium]
MRLKKLEIYGFKSFADRVEMRFDYGVTGIVGPNGCGKSNISDAVRWVLGEQSAKQLRGAKMEDVIFNGTEKRRRLSYCEVTLTFDNSDHALPIDFEEVAIARRVYRTGDSEYSINRAACRLKDIVDLFRDTGVGKEGYSLIGQGRVDEILSSKSEDRRQIFEEAAGIVKYRARRDEAEKRMANTRLNLSRVEDILAELNARIEPLREQSETAREYLKLRDELKVLELNLFLLKTERLTEKIDELRAQKGEMEVLATKAAEEQMVLTRERGEVENALSELETQAAAEREEVQRLIREVEAREGAVLVMRERMANSAKERERLNNEIAAAGEGKEGMLRRIQALDERALEQEKEVQESAAMLADKEAELQEKETLLSELEARAEEAKARIIREMNRLSDVRSEKARLTAVNDALARQLEQLSANNADEEEIAELREDYARAQNVLETEKAEESNLKAQSAEYDARVHELSGRADLLVREVQSLTVRRQETGARLKLLLEMQREYEGYQNPVKQVLLKSRKDSGSGVHGVVADLINVPEKLERAVDMALGGALQNIVVDRDEDAKKLIDYLRANRYGRATFLPLSSIRSRTLTPAERRVLNMPGCLGVASELIGYKDIYRGVIESLLGRTIVAENLEAGIQIQRASNYACRLVTLDGDVMHSGGSMTGGSVATKATSLLSRTREAETNKKLLDEITKTLEERQAEMENLTSELGEVKKARNALVDRVHQQEIAVTRAEAHLSKAQSELETCLQHAQRVRQEEERLRVQAAEVQQALQECEQQQNEASDTTSVTQAEIGRMQREIYERRNAVSVLHDAVSDARVAQTTAQRDWEDTCAESERMKAQSTNLERSKEEAEEALAGLSEREMLDALRLEEDLSALSELKQELDGARTQFNTSDLKRRDMQGRLRLLSDRAEEMRLENDELMARLHKNEMQLSRSEDELTQLTGRIWEEYELTYANAVPWRNPEFKYGESEKRIAAIRARIKQMGSVNVAAVDEYRQTMERCEQMSVQRDDLVKAQLDLQGIIDDLLSKMETQFKTQFETLNGYFQKTFVALFGGGHAELRLSDPKDALNCGIDIVAQPPGKKLQMLSLLSGGERALTAIAILFAMLTLKPTPFCILDEIEAALDDANIDNFAQYLKDYSQKTQFVVVTHRKGTMERCDALYGVTMQEKGVSKMISAQLSDIE